MTDLVETIVEAPPSCTWCAGPLLVPGRTLVIVRGSGGEQMLTCGARCLAALVVALAGRPATAWRSLAERTN